MQARLILVTLIALTAPAAAQQIVCEDAFGVDSSAARLIEIYGAENVVTGEVYGAEGMPIQATTVFPEHTKRRLQFIWLDDATLAGPVNIELSAKAIAPGGVRIGMPIGEVQQLNGAPFSLMGFDWDYGGYAWLETGELTTLPGGCYLSLRFEPGDYPTSLDTKAAMGEVTLSSDDPLLEKMGVRVSTMALGYPGPDDSD